MANKSKNKKRGGTVSKSDISPNIPPHIAPTMPISEEKENTAKDQVTLQPHDSTTKQQLALHGLSRLERFEDLFAELMIGFALAFLIAIGFAPQLVNLPNNIASVKWNIYKTDTNGKILLDANGKKLIDANGYGEYKEIKCPKCGGELSESTPFCPFDDTKISEAMSQVRQTYASNAYVVQDSLKIEIISDNFIVWYAMKKYAHWILYVLLILFCIKIIHEQSVNRYHLQNIHLPESAWINFWVFISRVSVLTFLYLLIIIKYTKGNSNFGNIYFGFAGLMVAAYILPDLTQYRQLLDYNGNDQNHRDIIDVYRQNILWRWLSLDFLNLLFIVWLTIAKNSHEGANLLTILLVLIIVGSGTILSIFQKMRIGCMKRWIGETFLSYYGDRNLSRFRKAFFLLLLALVLIPAVIFVSDYLGKKEMFSNNSIEYTWIIILVLSLNLFDWYFNRQLYFFSRLSSPSLSFIVMVMKKITILKCYVVDILKTK